jgi:hypothetical protein
MDVVVWLRSLGLGKYEALFRENDIDETVLPNLTAEDLKELGVASLGHRRKFLDAIAALRTDASGKAPSADAATASSASVEETEIVFIEVKTGRSVLSAREKAVMRAVEKKKVSWRVHLPKSSGMLSPTTAELSEMGGILGRSTSKSGLNGAMLDNAPLTEKSSSSATQACAASWSPTCFPMMLVETLHVVGFDHWFPRKLSMAMIGACGLASLCGLF